MKEWENYGDINYIEHGGVLIKKDESMPDNYHFIQACNVGGSLFKFACKGCFDLNEYAQIVAKIQKEHIEDVGSQMPESALAAEIVYRLEGINLGGKPICEKSVAVTSNNTESKFYLTAQELYEALQAEGFKIKNEQLDYVKSLDNKELAGAIQCYISEYGEDYEDEPCYDFIANPSSEKDASTKTQKKIEELLSDKEGVKKLQEYFNNELDDDKRWAENPNAIDLIQIYLKVLDERLEILLKTDRQQEPAKE